MNDITRMNRNPIMHAIVRHGDTLYTGGIAARDFSAPMEEQTRQALEKLAALLEGAGSDRSRILSTTVFITDMAHKPAMNAAWLEFFGDDLPTRATIGVADLEPGVLVEITAIAAVNSGPES